MHAFIISGGNPRDRTMYLEKRMETLKISPFATTVVSSDASTIGIDEIRTLQHQLSLKPVDSPYSLGVILDAEKLTTEAQHALLKTLEEPPIHALIYLLTQNPQALLPTIFSRCQIIDLGKSERYSKEELIKTLDTVITCRNFSIGKRLQFIDATFANRDDATEFLDRALYALHDQLISNGVLATLIRRILIAREQLSANVNYKLVLDSIFLS